MFHRDIEKLGKNLIVSAPENATKVQAGDVIGWAGDISSGALAFEQTTNDPSFLGVSSLCDCFVVETGSLFDFDDISQLYKYGHIPQL